MPTQLNNKFLRPVFIRTSLVKPSGAGIRDRDSQGLTLLQQDALVHIDAPKGIGPPPDPIDVNAVNLGLLLQAKIQARAIVALVAPPTAYLINLGQIPGHDRHTGPHAKAIGLSPSFISPPKKHQGPPETIG